MPFTAYATSDDVEKYIKGAVEALWIADSTDVDNSLARASREINEKLRGLERFADGGVPIDTEDDGSYAEVLIKFTVYTAVYNQLASTRAGELFEEHWKWLIQVLKDIWSGIKKGEYQFGPDPASSASARVFEIGRKSP